MHNECMAEQGLTPRQQRGIEIAKAARLSKRGNVWLLPSQNGSSRYTVVYSLSSPACSCKDFELRGRS